MQDMYCSVTRMWLKYLLLATVMAQQGFSSEAKETNLKHLIASSNQASNNVIEILGKRNKNVFYCPASSNILLSLVSLAARGKTAEELKAGLHLSELDDDELKIANQRLLADILMGGKLKLATRLFPKAGVKVTPEFANAARTYFGSDVQTLDYSVPASAVDIINKFVEEETNNKIHDLVKPENVGPDTNLLMVNAAHFKDNWLISFYNEEEAYFHHSKTEKVKTTMMDVTESFLFKSSASLKAKVVKLFFKNTNYSMVVVLPNDIDDFEEVEDTITKDFSLAYSDLQSVRVEVMMPKFKIESELNMKEILQDLGIKTMFTTDSDLSGLVEGTPLYVSEVFQKAYIDVNKYGVEAAAATDMHFVGYSGFEGTPVEFKANRPFLFAIMFEDYIIFQGKYSKVE